MYRLSLYGNGSVCMEKSPKKDPDEKKSLIIKFMDSVMMPDDTVKASLKISLAGIAFLIVQAVIMFGVTGWLARILLMQIQMILTFYLALRYIRSGYMTAIGLNIVSLLYQIRMTILGAEDSNLTLFFNLDIILTASLIAYYARRSQSNYQKALMQKDEISAAYYQAAISEEQLWKKNRELETSNRIINRDKEEMYRLANVDPLTQLPNRRMFQKKLDEVGKAAKKDNHSFALAFIDFDNFKSVNDTLGHHAGDELIRYMAFNLSKLTDPADMLGHIGGDEFVLIIQRELQRKDILFYIRRMAEMLRKPVSLGDTEVVVSASFGIAVFPDDSSNISELMRFADSAMYQSKREGKNRIRFFRKSMLDDIINETKLVQGLKTAIKNEELFLVFQPQYFVETGKLRGLETLIRWKSAEFGFVSPMKFIPLAEKNGMILQIGEWVMKHAFLAMKKIQNQYGFTGKIAVNVSAVQANESGFVGTIAKILKETGFDPGRLEIEITETAYTNSMDQVREMIAELQSLGIVVALDDFGTGYSSLSYLQQLPFDLVKIDKTFIDKINCDLQSNKFVSTMVSMVHQMNIPVLAEGVETEQQKAFLQLKKCDMIQGYLYGKPMPIDRVGALFTNSGDKKAN